jgi:hypothetical protein
MDGKLQRRLEKALSEVDEHGTTGPRLVDDAQRLWGRVRRLIDMKLIATEPDLEALELACYAFQLPRQTRMAASKLGKPNLKQRAEAAAELLVTLLAEEADEGLLDRATRLLHETPQRQPMIEEARLLADAVNLDDFGVSGMTLLMVQLSSQGGGARQLIEAYEKREEYGYWEARLKEGFHFDAVRQIAARRLEAARAAAQALLAEIKEDQP